MITYLWLDFKVRVGKIQEFGVSKISEFSGKIIKLLAIIIAGLAAIKLVAGFFTEFLNFTGKFRNFFSRNFFFLKFSEIFFAERENSGIFSEFRNFQKFLPTLIIIILHVR